MKKIFCVLLVVFSIVAKAQFVSGVGVMGGITYSNQKWQDKVLGLKENTKYLLRYNGCIFAEFFQHPNFRWVSELQYNMKGAKIVVGESTFKNKFDYFSFNNFLKIRFETFGGYPYFLIGPRVEYLFRTNAQILPEIANDFNTIHLSASAGIGYEFVTYGNWKPLVEAHYNPDVTNAYKKNDLSIKHQAFELRVGLKYVFQNNDCPPVLK